MTKPDTILIPGAWTRAAAFDDVRAVLADGGHPTDIIELPAHMSRVAQLDRGGLAAIDAVLDARIDASHEPPVLIGHSLGGLIALRAAQRHELRALVLLMPAPPSGMLRQLLADGLRSPRNALHMLGAAISVTLGGHLGIGAPDGLYSDRATDEEKGRGATYRADESWLILATLAIGSRTRPQPLHIPTLLIGGTQDRFTPINILKPLATALNAEFAEFDVAHAFNEESTHPVVTNAVVNFLNDNTALVPSHTRG